MEVVEKIADLRRIISEAKKDGRTIGFVPTMGALHEGHMSLVKASKDNGDFTVVSVFVNPTQFGPNEDFHKYPRPFEADAAKCDAAGVDVIFHPSVEETYPAGFGTFVDVEGVTEMLEGASRPGHFRGVATVVLKLLAAVEPDRAYFGMKDFQQLRMIEKMVRDLNIDIQIVPVPIFRETDGLAMSSRNAYLDPDQRKAALVLRKSLLAAKDAVGAGEKDAEKVKNLVLSILNAEPLAAVDYVAVVDPVTIQPVEEIEAETLVALAVRIGKTRLIDNMLIGGKDS